MKQLTQRLRDGRLEVIDVPLPQLGESTVLVDVRASLVSTGTERSKLDAARKGLIGKARARPDQARQVLDKARRDGVKETIHAVRMRLDSPSAIGYSASGVVIAVGERVRDVRVGDHVACGGAGAVHAEVIVVPANLCVPVPRQVDFAEAAFATVGAIAMHGVRQSEAAIGERVAVVGLGLVGQLCCQILNAAGCRVIGIDLSSDLVDRAVRSGVVEAGYIRQELTERLPVEIDGVDAVLLTAATPSADPVEFAARVCRDRGRVVVVGDVGLSFPRAAYYEKELEIRMSRSYGPGRYDREYEERGLDYPIGYVRWTERRNMDAFIQLLATEKIDVKGLISERVPIERAAETYEQRLTAAESPLGVVIEYGDSSESNQLGVPASRTREPAAPTSVGVIGAGSFAQRVMIPGLRAAGFELIGVASASGLSATGATERFGFQRPATAEEVVRASDIGLVAIATRHASHAELAERALRAGKAVFVEKPPCLTYEELKLLRNARDETGLPLVVGFNRPHAPLAKQLAAYVSGAQKPIELIYRVNAEALPPDHWQNDLDDGGGRMLGEGCHFVDFACWLIPAMPETVICSMAQRDGPIAASQSFTIVIGFSNGSSASIIYTAGGAADLPKEYLEVHSGGRSAVLRDFSTLETYGPLRRRPSRVAQDKGHVRQFEYLYALLNGTVAPAPHDQLTSMEVTLAALSAAQLGHVVTLPVEITQSADTQGSNVQT